MEQVACIVYGNICVKYDLEVPMLKWDKPPRVAPTRHSSNRQAPADSRNNILDLSPEVCSPGNSKDTEQDPQAPSPMVEDPGSKDNNEEELYVCKIDERLNDCTQYNLLCVGHCVWIYSFCFDVTKINSEVPEMNSERILKCIS